MTTRIAMWSGPRNLSTALLYAFAARGDCAVRDEPFYAAYLRLTGIDHPMREAVLAAHDADPDSVARDLLAPREAPVLYAKHMTLHMVAGVPRAWMRQVQNVFLIRDPARVVSSYARKRESPTLGDLGFRQQWELFDEVCQWRGTPPPVLAAESLRADPGAALRRLCAEVGIPFTPRMLSWPPGPKPFDGAWAPTGTRPSTAPPASSPPRRPRRTCPRPTPASPTRRGPGTTGWRPTREGRPGARGPPGLHLAPRALRAATSRSRSALSRMNPSASPWS